MRHLVSACLLLALSHGASAGIVYQWRTLEASSTISSAVGRIEITKGARAARGGSYVASPNCRVNYPDCDYGDHDSPVLKFSFRANSPVPTEADIDFDLYRGAGAFIPLSDWFAADFIISGRFLTLSAYADTGETTLFMDNNTISSFSSDALYYGSDCHAQNCSGATGQWVQVPEPGSAGLLGIGLLSALLISARAWPGATPGRAAHRSSRPQWSR